MTPQEVLDLFWKHIEEGGRDWDLRSAGWVADNIVVAVYSADMTTAYLIEVTEEGLSGLPVPTRPSKNYDRKDPAKWLQRLDAGR